MASLDSLPPDQRAVLQLVLQRGRSYDEIARLLSIDRAAVRERALTALDALGPGTRVPPERRALITDYLLGQLPARVSEDTRDHLGESPSERAWARVVASELGTLSNGPLPEIPVESVAREPAGPESVIADPAGEEPEPLAKPARKSFRRAPRDPKPPAAAPSETAARKSFRRAPREPKAPTAAASEAPARKSFRRAPREPKPPTAAASEAPARKSFRRAPREPEPPRPARPTPARPRGGDRAPERPSSRRGGAVLIAGGVVIVVLVVIVIVAVSGGSSPSPTTSAASTSTPASSTPASTPSSTTGTTTAGAKVVAQVNLSSPTGAKKTAGVAVVVKQGASTGLVIRAQGMTPNTSHDAYAVWLYNSASDNHILGFVNPGVKADGKLQTAGVLPANASHFKQILVTLETQARPKAPGKIVLQGALSIS